MVTLHEGEEVAQICSSQEDSTIHCCEDFQMLKVLKLTECSWTSYVLFY